MKEDKEFIVRVLINGDRPDYRIFSVFLWGNDHKIDSDGDSYNPASRSWTELYMRSRERKGGFEISQVSDNPKIFEVKSSNGYMANRAALFLARETAGMIVSPDNALHSYHVLVLKLGDFDLQQALERADQSVWRKSTPELPYPNLKER
jgi:hypothetical protein